MGGKFFWYSMMTGAIILWFFSIGFGYYLFPDNILLSFTPFLFLVILHSIEIPLVIKLLREKKVKSSSIAVKTFIFGFTWWLPFKKGIINK